MTATSSEHPSETTAGGAEADGGTARSSASASSPAAVTPSLAAVGPAPREVCPLCGETLRPEQDWCLRCGSAARTRLAAPAKWKLLALALVAVALLSIAVLVAALVELAG
jgi:hypothetical protein